MERNRAEERKRPVADDQREREAFFDWLDGAAAQNAQQNRALSEEEVLVVIEQARSQD